jgi:hypothetical protein
MTWKTLIHGKLLVKDDSLKNSAIQGSHLSGKHTTEDIRKKSAVSDEAIVLRMQHIIELVMKKGWDDYKFKFAATEAARQIDSVDDIADCSEVQLDAWASSIVIRMIQQRGQVPTAWTRVSRCAHCGPVWSEHGLPTLSCGWCWMRVAGKSFPRP